VAVSIAPNAAPAPAAPATPIDQLHPATSQPQPAAVSSQPAVSPTGSFMVQIAAVSTQEIADIELTALKKYGYDVVVRHEPQDQLLHIQVGPYATRKDAEAMRQNILAHGFNAIVK
jgi:cell division septation protein DedD